MSGILPHRLLTADTKPRKSLSKLLTPCTLIVSKVYIAARHTTSSSLTTPPHNHREPDCISLVAACGCLLNDRHGWSAPLRTNSTPAEAPPPPVGHLHPIDGGPRGGGGGGAPITTITHATVSCKGIIYMYIRMNKLTFLDRKLSFCRLGVLFPSPCQRGFISLQNCKQSPRNSQCESFFSYRGPDLNFLKNICSSKTQDLRSRLCKPPDF